ncbi:MAG: hypothetical protein ABJH82_09360 [Polaribacter sp.]|uniref:hypothetical protein n=1 Tax=Polaribacter sp. TaxID=1920175 RepID=UPI00326415C0
MKTISLLLFMLFASLSLNAICVSGDCENGFGTYIWEDGDMYAGFWKNGNKHYFGMYFWKNGDFWYGLYKDGNRKPGFGIYAWQGGDSENRTNSVSYNEKGCVSGNCEEGWGVYIYSSGNLHAGYWKNGKPHYFGAKFWKSGDYYLGLYKNGSRKPTPHGYYVFDDKTSKSLLGPIKFDNTGCVEGDCENGFGTYIWKNGDLHTGYWFKGKAHLIAFKFWNEKDIFLGLYKNGERKKRGIYIYEDGDVDIRTEKVFFNYLTIIEGKQKKLKESGGNQSAPEK